MRTRVLLCTLLAAAIGLVAPAAATAAGWVPGQFVAKMYTEALGRLPDQSGWQGQSNWISTYGCTAGTLRQVGTSIYTSTEYSNLGYSHGEMVLTLYRGALNREPDQAGYSNYVSLLDGGFAWSNVVQSVFSSTEFTNLATSVCTGAVDAAGTSYFFGTQPALATSPVGSGFSGAETDLQALLNTTSPGGVVALARDAVIPLTAPLVVPAGVTLTTSGAPDTRHYAQMARLVRAAPFNDFLVTVQGGGTVSSVWIDGARDTPDVHDPTRSNVRMLGGNGTTLTSSRVDNTPGPHLVQVMGSFDGYPCPAATVSGNLLTGYSSDHLTNNAWTDGVAASCEHTTITWNQVVDASDVAIVLYRSSPYSQNVAQASLVSHNTVLSAGTSMFAALGVDPLSETTQALRSYDFTGSSVTTNTIWTSPNTHFDIGLADGTRAWFGSAADTGTGASITNNTSGTQPARVLTGLAVSGMVNTTVSGNTATWVHGGGYGTCPDVDVAASLTAGTASGQISPSPVNVAFDSCIGSSR